MGIVTFQGYSCDRCGHEWVPRIMDEIKPALCPKCKSAYWDRPTRMEQAKKKERIEQGRKEATMKYFKKKAKNNR